jgi:hypothetical protein
MNGKKSRVEVESRNFYKSQKSKLESSSQFPRRSFNQCHWSQDGEEFRQSFSNLIRLLFAAYVIAESHREILEIKKLSCSTCYQPNGTLTMFKVDWRERREKDVHVTYRRGERWKMINYYHCAVRSVRLASRSQSPTAACAPFLFG